MIKSKRQIEKDIYRKAWAFIVPLPRHTDQTLF